MNTTELRKGNYLEYKTKEIVEVSGILSGLYIKGWKKGCLSKNQFKPILLTEEWLLKFGFKTHENYFWYKKGNVFSNMLSVGIQNKDGVITIIENVNHVHSLQNLYFALTGEELTLNNVV